MTTAAALVRGVLTPLLAPMLAPPPALRGPRRLTFWGTARCAGALLLAAAALASVAPLWHWLTQD